MPMRQLVKIGTSLLILALTVGQALAEAPPVDFTLLGVEPVKGAIHYQVKINTTKPVEQVDLNLVYLDQSGKEVMKTDVIWQNIVNSERRPIEAGKTYTVEDFLPDGAVKAEGKLLRVFFKDGSIWKAPQ